MRANDGRRSHVKHRITPIQSGEQRQAHASHVIHASWFDTTIDIPRELSAKDQILSAGRAGIRKNEMLSLRTSESNPMIAHVNRSMHSSCQTRPAFTGVGHRSARGPNY